MLLLNRKGRRYLSYSCTDSPSDSFQSEREASEPEGPHPIQIVLAQEDHSFNLDLEALKEVLLSEDVANRKVVVLSVAGAFRKGKSFLLDYFLRFLTNKVSAAFHTLYLVSVQAEVGLLLTG